VDTNRTVVRSAEHFYPTSIPRHRAKCSIQHQLCRLGKRGYGGHLTKLLEKALEAVRRLPPDSHDEIARAMLSLTGAQVEPEEIDPAHLSDVLEGLAQAKRRQFATDVGIESAFRRFEQ
jgi:hypothetical protein